MRKIDRRRRLPSRAQCLFKFVDPQRAKESRVHWKKRLKQIQQLQAKHGKDRSLAREFPDLNVEQRTAPCSNGMRGSTARLIPPSGMKRFPVGHSHKQGLELIIPGTRLAMDGGQEDMRAPATSAPTPAIAGWLLAPDRFKDFWMASGW